MYIIQSGILLTFLPTKDFLIEPYSFRKDTYYLWVFGTKILPI